MKSRKNKSSRKFLLMWDMLGLEYIEDLTSIAEQQTWAVLKGEEIPKYPNLNVLTLRAQANHQRHYEIYVIDVIDITREDLINQFKESPQFIVDLVREKGVQLYSNRANLRERVII